ncbi:MAG: S9 family peptidase, partial [Pseudomonadota bacterium]|nr:S9 family peptidase [Pseudomonadota bacterium]
MPRRITTWSAALGVLAIAACSPTEPGGQETVATETEAETGGRQIVQIDPSNDPRVWLEEVEGEEAMAWVEGQNERTYERLQGDALYDTLYNEALAIYESTDRIPYGSFYAGYVWNFWQDSENTHGLWRRTSLESYLSDDPDWDVILDLDALSEAEGRNWVWRGSNCLTPDYDRCILTLSDGGSDAAVRREFLISERAFVEDGFITPESKGGIDWIDENTVMIGLAIGEEDSTDSGYASVAYRWERGTPYESATEIIRGDRTDVAMWGFRMEDSDGTAYMMMSQAVTFYDSVYWHLPDGGEPMQMPLPAKSSL